MLSLSQALVLLLAGTGAIASPQGPSPVRPAGAAVETPQPTQPGIVKNCNKFYLVVSGDTCNKVAAAQGITVEQFQRWNAQTGPDCTTLQADAYACIGVDSEPSEPPKEPTETPRPIQPGMVKNCIKFHNVKSGETCAAIQKRYNVSLRQLTTWNPSIRPDCTNMWADTYLCVGVRS